MDPLPNKPLPELGWSHVGIGFSFIVVNSVISHVFHLHVGTSLAIAAIRCVLQLTVMATILQSVFATKNLWAVVGIAGAFFSEYPLRVISGSLTFKPIHSRAERSWHARNR
jgi:ABC-type iron transport system FetAB permease component